MRIASIVRSSGIEIAGQSFVLRCGKSQTAVIGLHGADNHHHFGPFIERGSHDVFELARPVAAAGQSQLIITLDPDRASCAVISNPESIHSNSD